MDRDAHIIGPRDLVLVTGATGFIGPAVVERLLRRGHRNLRLFSRLSSDAARLEAVIDRFGRDADIDMVQGNLLSTQDCARAGKDVSVVFHLASGGDKSFPGAVMASVVTTRNLLDACRQSPRLRRFVNVSSFAVYANTQPGPLLESSPVEEHGHSRGDAYTYAKLKQDEIVARYGRDFGLPHVIVRPGSVFGPGKASLTGRVGIDSFGIFLHMGGPNRIPLTYIDNCAHAIVLAGLVPGIEGEIFNIVDDDLPSSRRFLRLYKRQVRNFPSLYVPHALAYLLCWMWEKYSASSAGQLPPAFNRGRWRAEWKPTRYSNAKLKTRLGWKPLVSMDEGLARFFESCRKERHA